MPYGAWSPLILMLLHELRQPEWILSSALLGISSEYPNPPESHFLQTKFTGWTFSVTQYSSSISKSKVAQQLLPFFTSAEEPKQKKQQFWPALVQPQGRCVLLQLFEGRNVRGVKGGKTVGSTFWGLYIIQCISKTYSLIQVFKEAHHSTWRNKAHNFSSELCHETSSFWEGTSNRSLFFLNL